MKFSYLKLIDQSGIPFDPTLENIVIKQKVTIPIMFTGKLKSSAFQCILYGVCSLISFCLIFESIITILKLKNLDKYTPMAFITYMSLCIHIFLSAN